MIHVDLENISEGAAISKGIEVFVELTLFYGLLLAIAMYELKQRNVQTKSLLERLSDVEKEQGRLE